uniref:Uncharacterized protein n=1 Tax=Lactuca sativa TaxID=4236 RepID=A0A9R1V506_LACSA|nr:hypothetical protein LSAT_V11C600307870 [Lactuca sativa]
MTVVRTIGSVSLWVHEITKNQEFVVQKLKESVLDEIKGSLTMRYELNFTLNHIYSFASRHHVYRRSGGPKSVNLKEVGPWFELKLYRLGQNFMQHTPQTRSTFVSVRMRT